MQFVMTRRSRISTPNYKLITVLLFCRGTPYLITGSSRWRRIFIVFSPLCVSQPVLPSFLSLSFFFLFLCFFLIFCLLIFPLYFLSASSSSSSSPWKLFSGSGFCTDRIHFLQDGILGISRTDVVYRPRAYIHEYKSDSLSLLIFKHRCVFLLVPRCAEFV